jgi:septum formation protein
VRTVVVSAEVRFAPIDAELLEWYLATPEPYDKAGAYAVHLAGGLFVAEVRGSISGVVGLPLVETLGLLRG